MIRFQDVSLSFENLSVLQNFSFSVDRGEKVCVSGSSGKGKSTVLKMIQGYVLPDKGCIEVAGLTLNSENVNSIREKIAYVPQNINLPVNNARELIKLIGSHLREDLAGRYALKLGLETEMMERSFSEMSGGQKQRLVVAVCLALNREILLLDEPTSSLDKASTGLLIDLLKELDGQTIVSASHDQNWMKAMDRVLPV